MVQEVGGSTPLTHPILHKGLWLRSKPKAFSYPVRRPLRSYTTVPGDMNLFGRSKRHFRRAIVLGLDGVPCSLARRLIDEGRMPNLASLVQGGSLLSLKSVVPTVSSVAWTSIATGCQPGRHGLFGFIDRVPATHEMFIPTARNRRVRTWIEHFNSVGKRVVSIGVPGTYPPRAVNGIVVSGFLAPSLEKGTYPLQVATELKSMGYVIDIDSWQARENKESFLDEVFDAFERRMEAVLRLMGREDWDLFVAHFLDTDRLHHFLWGEMEDQQQPYTDWFYRFYTRVDDLIGEVKRHCDGDTALMILSDHGFCRLRKEVHLNYWLRESGFLRFNNPEPRQLLDMTPETRCYTLLPGRFYVCLKGRERNGCVAPGSEYESVREDVAAGLKSLRDPETGDPVIEEVKLREELFEGEAVEAAPDLVAIPSEGYDLKGGFEKKVLMERGGVSGTHTLGDAMLYVNQPDLARVEGSILDVFPTLLDLMGLDPSEPSDGSSLMDPAS